MRRVVETGHTSAQWHFRFFVLHAAVPHGPWVYAAYVIYHPRALAARCIGLSLAELRVC